MFAELVGWYTGRDQNRRRYPRVKKDFDVESSLGRDHRSRLKGVDLSGGGMCLISQDLLPNAIFDARINLDGRQIDLKVLRIWNAVVHADGKDVRYHGLQFVAVDAEDWVAIIHWITGDSLSKLVRLEELTLNQVEVVKFLPSEFRTRLLSELEKRSRLDPNAPLPVQFDYGGVVDYDGRAMHRFTLHSKMSNNSKETRFSTRLLVDETAEHIVVLN